MSQSVNLETVPPSAATSFVIAGMTCSGCARHVTEALQSVAGVASADVSLELGRASVRWQPEVDRDSAALIRAVEKAGYQAKVLDASSTEAQRSSWSPFSGWLFNVVIGSILTIPLLILEWGFGVGEQRWYHWLAFGLVLPIQTLCGARFYRGAWNQLMVGSSNMDTLVVLGSTAAFVFSAWGLFAGWAGHLFFMESAAIITLISVGHWIESKVSARAASSLRALLNLAPQTARVIQADGQELSTPVAQLRRGDRVAVKPGDRISTDGEVLEGASAVDESMLTGESAPVDKTPGAKVFAGTLNHSGRLILRVTATGENSALAQIIQVVQRAQNSRANIQKLGDRVSSVFVPVVVGIAILTGLWWGFAPESARAVSGWMESFLWHAHHPEGALAGALYHAVAVLIIACPCAMGLATPIAIMAGTNVASERGILIRDGVALEKSGRLTAVMFDKTGTLTQGKLVVEAREQIATSAQSLPDWESLAAALARPSLHPLSQAVATISAVPCPLTDWREVRGSGVQASWKKDSAGFIISNFPPLPSKVWSAGFQPAGPLATPEAGWKPTFRPPERRALLGTNEDTNASGRAMLGAPIVRLGSLRWLQETGVNITSATAFANQWSKRGATILGVALEAELLGVIALRDTLKANAAAVIAGLQRSGQRVYLITGDNQRTAAAIAEQTGIPSDAVFAEVRPEAKADIVRQLQGRGERVAFVGDGINDAPALEQADLGIAVARASDVAREAADIVLLKSDLQAIPEALALAQATLRTIKQNLFWAFFYNAAGIPLAMFGFLSPVLSALAMGLSDLMVVGNALRLRRWRRLPAKHAK